MADQRFYKLLGHLYRSGAFAYYWTPDGPTVPEPDGSQRQEKIARWFAVGNIPEVPAAWGDLNVYFAVNPSTWRRSEHERANKEDIAALNALYAEFDDLDDFGKQQVIDKLTTGDLPPSVIIDSGGGLHAYWLLRDPYVIACEDDREHAEQVQRAWVHLFGPVGADLTVHDIARVLRVPGTHNYKPEYGPDYPEIQIRHWQPQTVYELVEIETEVQPILDQWAEEAAAAATARSTSGPVGLTDAELLAVLFGSKNGSDYERLWNGDLSVCGGDHSACDQKLCNGLAWLTGKDAAAIDRLFRQSGLYRAKWEKQGYRDRTITSAIDTCRTVYDPAAGLDPSAVQAGQAAVNSSGPQPSSGGQQSAGQNKPTPSDLAHEYLMMYPDTMYSRGTWHRYNGGAWAPVHDQIISREIYELLELSAPKMTTESGLRNVRSFVKAMVYTPEEYLDNDDELINLQNGVYNLELGVLLSHDPSRRLTTQLPFAYDPAATAPHWDLYRRTTFVDENGAPDPELDAFMAEAVGYSLTTDIRYHVAFWCKGEGANGKSVLFHVLERLAGNAAIPFNVDLLSLNREPYQLADLAGKRIALCSEARSDTIVEDAVIKMLVAGDSMTVRQIRREPFTLRPAVKLWWSMNKLPTVTDTSTGFWRRVKLIPFRADFEGRDRHKRIDDLKDRLDLELPGIFNWAMQGLARLRQNGAFTRVNQIEELTAAYRRESNTIESFVSDECDVDPGHSVGSASLYARYRSWCEDNGFKPYNTRNFKSELERLGYPQKRIGTTRAYTGLRIRF